MATTRATFGSILSTVTTTATTINNVLDTANQAVSMATAYVTKAAEEQRLRHIEEKDKYLHELLQQSAIERAENEKKVETYRNQSDFHKEAYDRQYARLEELFKLK